MPLPFILGAAAAAAGAIGAAAGVKGAIDTKEANDVQGQAQSILNRAQREMDTTRKTTADTISDLGKVKLDIFAHEINDFVTYYSKLKNVILTQGQGIDEFKVGNFSPEQLKEMKSTVLSAVDVVGSGVAGIGAGALLGWGTYGGVMALGTASTGTAIGTLSGAAATNATLAWLGGGAISAGGGGMALGTAVLGGLVAGPALLIAGGIFGAKAKEKLDNAYSNLSEAKRIEQQLKVARMELSTISLKARQMNDMLEILKRPMQRLNGQLLQITSQKTDWRTLTDTEKQTVAAAVKHAQVVKMIVDVPLLTQSGALTPEAKNIVNNEEIKALTTDAKSNPTGGTVLSGEKAKGTPVSRMADALLEEAARTQTPLARLGKPQGSVLWKIVNGDIMGYVPWNYKEYFKGAPNLGLIKGNVSTDAGQNYEIRIFYNKNTYAIRYYEAEYRGDAIVQKLK